MFLFHQRRQHGLVRLGIILAAFVPNLFLVTRPAYAASVSIVSQNVGCDYLRVTYTVAGTTLQDTASLTAYSSSTSVGTTTSPGYPGTHTDFIPLFPIQPTGTLLHVVVSVAGASAQGAPTPCTGGRPGGPPQKQPPSQWTGYSDGRLNPHPDEYYSVWCQNNLINVYRAIPQSQLLQQIPLGRVIALDAVHRTFNAGNGLIVSRNNDAIYIEGNNGNAAPAHGGKSFSLSDCIAHNGGAPPTLFSAPVSVPVLDPCHPPADPQTLACFNTHPCMSNPAGFTCLTSTPCLIDPNSLDCEFWKTGDFCIQGEELFCQGLAILHACTPPLGFVFMPLFVLGFRSRRKAYRSKRALNLVRLLTEITNAPTAKVTKLLSKRRRVRR